ncbi:MAG: hypothetical protein NZ928_06960 [Endomicrobia bacterium]|nr:hypothetical protein [Endomicrobiia bacterium]MDW8055758.1 hypothetical protein [Elusimicrobiota bacterium]
MLRKKQNILGLILMLNFILAAVTQATIDFSFQSGINFPIVSGYEMRNLNAFSVVFHVNEETSVSIFRESGKIRGENSYTDNANVKYTIVNEGDSEITGLRITHLLPVELISLSLGLDIGNIQFNTQNIYRRSTGGGDRTDWGLPQDDPLRGTHPLFGLFLEWKALESEGSQVKTKLTIALSARMVDLPETFALGARKARLINQPQIDPIKNFNNISLIVGLKIGF